MTTVALPSITDGDAVVEDIQKIQQGLSDLPEDLLNFILAIEKRLQEVEALLQAFGAGSSISPASTGTEPILAGPTPPVYSAVDPVLISSAATTSSTEPSTTALCRNGGAGPLVPCGELYRTTRTSHLTRTQAFPWTVTKHMPIPTGVLSNVTIPFANDTAITPPAPWTAPYKVTPSSSVTPRAVTYTVSYAPEPSVVLPTTTSQGSGHTNPTLSPYTFDPASEDNVAVYYGTGANANAATGLQDLCQSTKVDIVLLSFLSDFFSAESKPTLDVNPGCNPPNEAQKLLAPGLKDCTPLAYQVSTCQSIGKKVLLSLGGYGANTTFDSDDQATDFATTLWDLFGAGLGLDSDLRPFGPEIILDGFDLDNESHSTAHYETFATTLRDLYKSDTSKQYYLSAAPQCPIPDESIPIGALALADFVFVQFYNNPSCNLDSEGFQNSFQAWTALLTNASTLTSPSTPTSPIPEYGDAPRNGPMLYIGAGAFEGAGSGYVIGSGLSTRVSLARELSTENFGGMMLWDGPRGMANVDQYGMTYLDYAKDALH